MRLQNGDGVNSKPKFEYFGRIQTNKPRWYVFSFNEKYMHISLLGVLLTYLFIFQLAQPIKLYPPGTPANVTQTDTENPVVAENYDEVVFTNPTETFFQQLQSVGRAPPVSYAQEDHFPEYSDSKEVKLLLEAHRFLQDELALAKERLLQVDGDLAQVDEALRQQQDKRKKAAAAAAKAGSTKPAARSKSTAPRPAAAAPASKKAKTST